MQGGAAVACEAHNLEVGGSNPSPATRPRYYLASKIIKYVDRTINQPNGRRILVN